MMVECVVVLVVEVEVVVVVVVVVESLVGNGVMGLSVAIVV